MQDDGKQSPEAEARAIFDAARLGISANGLGSTNDSRGGVAGRKDAEAVGSDESNDLTGDAEAIGTTTKLAPEHKQSTKTTAEWPASQSAVDNEPSPPTPVPTVIQHKDGCVVTDLHFDGMYRIVGPDGSHVDVTSVDYRKDARPLHWFRAAAT